MVTKGTVLVVDDEINLCRIIGAKLARSGYDVVAVHDGLQAVEKVRESDFDVVLLDLILPKMDGLTALAQIRRVRDKLPVIVMTACENAEAFEKAKDYGVSACLNKPFDLDSLVALVTDTSRSSPPSRARRLPESTVLFAPDQPITLEINNGGLSRVYPSRISAKDDRTLTVVAPRADTGCVQVAQNTSVKIGLAAKDAYYGFTTRVLRCGDNPGALMVLEKPSVIYRVQRREHPRFPIRIPVLCGRYCEDGGEESEMMAGETRDLSLSGACLLLPREILPGEILRVELRPKSGEDVVVARAQVARSRPVEDLDQSGYLLGCRFVLVDGSLQKLLKG